MQNLLFLAENNGVVFAPFTEIKSVEINLDSFKIYSTLNHDNNLKSYEFKCNQFVNCAGLDAQQLAFNLKKIG